MPGRGPSSDKEEIILAGGLAFQHKITGTAYHLFKISDTISGKWRSRWGMIRKPGIWGNWRFSQRRAEWKQPSRRESRIGVRKAKGSGDPLRIKGTKLPVSPFIRLLILHPHLHNLYSSTHLLHYTVTLDSGSKAGYVRRQVLVWGFSPYPYLSS